MQVKRIEFLRRQKGLSQRAFGQMVGVDASYICNAERNGFMYPRHIERIANALKLDDGGLTLLDEVSELKEVG